MCVRAIWLTVPAAVLLVAAYVAMQASPSGVPSSTTYSPRHVDLGPPTVRGSLCFRAEDLGLAGAYYDDLISMGGR